MLVLDKKSLRTLSFNNSQFCFKLPNREEFWMAKTKTDQPTQSATKLNRFLNEEQVADVTGVSLATLRRWRVLGTGPKFRKLGTGPKSPVRYDPADLEAWIASMPSGGARAAVPA